ncbi:pterin-4-alpha-carbinolamine dehydratase [Geoalkalibacter ferrihydriticus]|uniref:Putative pterin-4-alpha-carbinolamine dehydratase n=2 Tax=Geoalkalibacter ferrihydriticus TaxID=392333 RepID=A0A0C2EFA0_9BACT|nr:4a-hydroxytetrahydrobiopterin dehydratase [Geoalkalibacter ferrihydriticus]KIH77293.1 pterin-4-alpha-carbinolamine dehydratase [Geoalkalibacter ferrihydriticus DSM 17813]SDM21364.1 pterin-4-alpha-carbinolamine dehydratase [Geoalkalibacter ferrihydriticus]
MTESCALAGKSCIPCKGGVPPLSGKELTALAEQLSPEWSVESGHHLTCTYTFKNFKQALAFTNAIGEVAEHENHHPEITLTWGLVTARIWTHKIDGLTESDFILAAKISALEKPTS